ncbi:hypothetical protein K3495_g3147 [Podosphaera aphanis]|nr:hypothetical protein K3495_g3147 [Podosphaera aphanis]
MQFDHPQTPESPLHLDHTKYPKQTSSPRAHSLPTPTHSTNGSVSSLDSEMSLNELSCKRKREADDTGNQTLKKPHIEDGRLCLEDLHLDVGKKYKLCHTPHNPAIPDLRQDLFALFGLESIAKSVARTNPDGSKGVKLRKTYKNHIKDHQLSGNFDSVKREMDAPDTLFALMTSPEDRWDAERARGESVENGIPTHIRAQMGRAFKMSRGSIPKSLWNNSMLGELVNPLASSEPTRPAKVNATKSHQTQLSGALRSVKVEAPRPKRSIKKRTYGDSSYEGYGEGYVDDEGQEVDFPSGDPDTLSRKRPKKSASSHGFQAPPARHNSYGPGMVGA